MLQLVASKDPSEHPVVYHGIVLVTLRLENAGRAFFAEYEQNGKRERLQNRPTRSPCPPSKPSLRFCKKKPSQTPSVNRLKRLLNGPNLYDVLGLDDTCSAEFVRKQYRSLALIYHPDKSASTAEQDPSLPQVLRQLPREEAFILLQDAYEVLSDPASKLQYDSSLPFDDSVPTSAELTSEMIAANPQVFFDVLGPVFKRNARWSLNKPVPLLGTLETPPDEVMAFYNFWWGFDSLRLFTSEDEYDLTEADCREERRWMEKLNQKANKKKKQQEHERIVGMVAFAYGLDPRLSRTKKKKAKKPDKVDSSSGEAKPPSLTEDEQKAAVQQSEADLAEKKKHKAYLRKCRQKLREIVRHPDLITDIANFVLDEEISEFVSSAGDFDHEFQQLESISDPLQRVRTFRHRLKDLAALKAAPMTPLKATETAKEAEPLVRQPSVSTQWTDRDTLLLKKGLAKFPPGTPQRWVKISEMVEGKPLVLIVEKAKLLAVKNAAQDHTPKPARDLTKSKWTVEQQQALEKALKQHSSMKFTPEKWDLIAAEVTDKTAEECQLRFHQVREAIQKKAAKI